MTSIKLSLAVLSTAFLTMLPSAEALASTLRNSTASPTAIEKTLGPVPEIPQEKVSSVQPTPPSMLPAPLILKTYVFNADTGVMLNETGKVANTPYESLPVDAGGSPWTLVQPSAIEPAAGAAQSSTRVRNCPCDAPLQPTLR